MHFFYICYHFLLTLLSEPTYVDTSNKTSISYNRDMNQTYPAMTRRETIHGGSTPASMRVMVIAGYAQFISLAVNGTVVTCYNNPMNSEPFSIGKVERDTGIARDTLRIWERRYGFPEP